MQIIESRTRSAGFMNKSFKLIKPIHCKDPSQNDLLNDAFTNDSFTNQTCRSQSCTQEPDQPESRMNHSNWFCKLDQLIHCKDLTKKNCFVHKIRKADYLVNELNLRTKSAGFVNWIKQIIKQIWLKIIICTWIKHATFLLRLPRIVMDCSIFRELPKFGLFLMESYNMTSGNV